MLGLGEEGWAALEEQRRRVTDVGDCQDEEPDEADGGQQPGAVLVVVGVGLVVVEEGDEAQAEAESEVEAGADDAPLAPGLGASDNSEDGHQDESDSCGDIRVLELYNMVKTGETLGWERYSPQDQSGPTSAH